MAYAVAIGCDTGIWVTDTDNLYTAAQVVVGDSNPKWISWSPDGTKLAVVISASPYLKIYNTSDWSFISASPNPGSATSSVAWSPDGTKLAVVISGSPCLKIYNTSNWSQITGTPNPGSQGFSVSWSPDGTKLAVSMTSSPWIRVYNTSDWSQVSSPPVVGNNVYGIAWSPDGTRLAVTQYSTPAPYLRVYDTSDWSLLSSGTNSSSIYASYTGTHTVVYSPDGSLLFYCISVAPYVRCMKALESIYHGFSTGGPVASIDITPDNQIVLVPKWEEIGIYRNTPEVERNNAHSWEFDNNGWYAGSTITFLSICKASNTSILSSITGTVKDWYGRPIGGIKVICIKRSNNTLVYSTTTDSEGEYKLVCPYEMDVYVIVNDSRYPDSDSPVDIRPVRSSVSSPPFIETILPNVPGDNVVKTGTAVTVGSDPVDEVVALEKRTKEVIAKAIPESNGQWTMNIPEGYDFYLAYFYNGCQSKITGPYSNGDIPDV